MSALSYPIFVTSSGDPDATIIIAKIIWAVDKTSLETPYLILVLGGKMAVAFPGIKLSA